MKRTRITSTQDARAQSTLILSHEIKKQDYSEIHLLLIQDNIILNIYASKLIIYAVLMFSSKIVRDLFWVGTSPLLNCPNNSAWQLVDDDDNTCNGHNSSDRLGLIFGTINPNLYENVIAWARTLDEQNGDAIYDF